MNRITAVIMPDADGTLHLPLPEAWRSQSIRVKAELEPLGAVTDAGDSAPSLKGFGCLRGRISMSPDFDEPLEDFREYME